MGINILFGFAGAFTVANLYYSHPILNILAEEFGVSNETASHVPTLMQAGYAIGLAFLCPLGDLFKRRPFVLCLVLFTSTIWYAPCASSPGGTPLTLAWQDRVVHNERFQRLFRNLIHHGYHDSHTSDHASTGWRSGTTASQSNGSFYSSLG